MCQGQGRSWGQYPGRAIPLCGFTSGNVSGSQLHHCHVLSPHIQEQGTGSGSPMQQTQVILGTTHNSQCPWSWRGVALRSPGGVVPLPLAQSQLPMPSCPGQSQVHLWTSSRCETWTNGSQSKGRGVRGWRLSLGKLYVVSVRVLTPLISASNL